MRIGLSFDLNATRDADDADDRLKEDNTPARVAALGAAIRRFGYDVTELGNGRELIRKLLDSPPDFLFNITQGQGNSRSRDSHIAAVCEMLGIPYNGSDPLALAVARDRDAVRRMVVAFDITVPNGLVLTVPAAEYDGDYAEFPAILQESGLQLPVIVKPIYGTSSGRNPSTCLIRRIDELGPAIVKLWRDSRQSVLVEEFIEGDEIIVGVIGNDPPHVFGVMRVFPKFLNPDFVYDAAVKCDLRNQVSFECPAQLPMPVRSAIENAALAVFAALGCRDYARLAFRVRGGVPYFLAVDPLPDLSPPRSDLVVMADLLGHSYEELIELLLHAGLTRTHRHHPSSLSAHQAFHPMSLLTSG